MRSLFKALVSFVSGIFVGVFIVSLYNENNKLKGAENVQKNREFLPDIKEGIYLFEIENKSMCCSPECIQKLIKRVYKAVPDISKVVGIDCSEKKIKLLSFVKSSPETPDMLIYEMNDGIVPLGFEARSFKYLGNFKEIKGGGEYGR